VNKKEIIEHELIALLRSFTGEEIKKFGLYLRSPYFSKRRALSVFYIELIKYHPLYTHIRLTKESLYKKVYKGKAYKDSSMRDLFTETISSAKDFLAFESFASGYQRQVNILQQLRLRNQHRLFKNQVRKSDIALTNYGGINPEFFILKYQIDAERYNENLVVQRLTTPKKALILAKEISDSSINLIIYSILEIVSIYIIMLINCEKSRAVQLEKYINDVVNKLSLKKTYEQIKGKSKYDYIINIYDLLLIAFLKRGNWKAYNNYKMAVINSLEKIGHDEASELYSNMIRISILGTQSGDSRHEFDMELLDLYDSFLRNKYFRIDKSIYVPADLYRAIIFQAVKMNCIDWLRKLIKDSGPWLNPDSHDSLLNYAGAYYSFATADYNTALDCINKVNIEYYLFKYDLYILKLKVFYESKEMEPALDLILAFRMFITNEKLMNDEMKDLYRSFANFLEKIIRISVKSSHMDADTLMLKFQKNRRVISAGWLGEKIQILQGKITEYNQSV